MRTLLRLTQRILDDSHVPHAGKGVGSFFALLAWWSLLLAILSGIVLTFHYRPWGDVFRAVSRLTGFIPFGNFLRTFHYLSGQGFLLFTLVHVLDCFRKVKYRSVPSVEWIGLTGL